MSAMQANSSSSSEETARLVMEVVPELMGALRGEMRSSAEAFLTVPQFRVLNQISKARCTNGELAEWMGVAAPTMSRMVSTLSRKRLVRLKLDPADKRSQRIELTAQGKELVAKIRGSVRSNLACRLDSFGPEDSRNLHRLLTQLRDCVRVS